MVLVNLYSLTRLKRIISKYDNAKIFVFDKAASCKVLCKAIGGNFYNLLVDTDSLNFQPLANIGFDSNNRWNTEMQWTYNWLCDFFQKMVIRFLKHRKRSSVMP